MSARRGPGPWLFTTLGILALIGLAAWPLPTLYALGVLVGASAVLGGLWAAVGHQRKDGRTSDGPAEYGPPPDRGLDPIRTSPDPAGPDAADQVWRWNHATPAQRLDYATRAITAADRLRTVDQVLIGAVGRDDLAGADVIARVRAALDQLPPEPRPPQ